MPRKKSRWFATGLAAQVAIDEFQGPVQQLNGMLDGDIPHAIVLLERMSRALEVYANGQIPAAISWDELVCMRAEESMAQPVEEMGDDERAKPAGAVDRSNGSNGQSAIRFKSQKRTLRRSLPRHENCRFNQRIRENCQCL